MKSNDRSECENRDRLEGSDPIKSSKCELVETQHKESQNECKMTPIKGKEVTDLKNRLF